jgi:hypothetical protein
MTLTIKEQAVSLRKQGLTYAQISSALDGAVSVDWCKRNLKTVEYKKADDPILIEIIALALRPEGCTNYELTGIVMKHNPELIDKKGTYMSAYKRKARDRNKNSLFRPSWISPTKAFESSQAMYSIADSIFERIQEAVRDYADMFPEVQDKKAILDEIVKISNAHLVKEGLSTRLSRYERVVERLIDRHSD